MGRDHYRHTVVARSTAYVAIVALVRLYVVAAAAVQEMIRLREMGASYVISLPNVPLKGEKEEESRSHAAAALDSPSLLCTSTSSSHPSALSLSISKIVSTIDVASIPHSLSPQPR